MERSKRSPFDFVGTGLKYLFGTMDNEDKLDLQEKLITLSSSRKNDKDFNLNLINIMEKSILQVNDSLKVINNHANVLKMLNFNISILSENYALGKNLFSYNILLEDIKDTFFGCYYELSRKIDALHQMLIDLHNDVFNTKVIGFNTLITGLKNIKLNIENYKLPIDLQEPNLEILRKLTKYAFLRKDSFYYIVSIVPLIEESPLVMQKFYSIPKIIDNKATFLNLNDLTIISDQKLEKIFDFA